MKGTPNRLIFFQTAWLREPMCKVLFAEQIIKFIPNLRIPAKSKKSICKSISRSVHQFLANPQIQQKEPQSQRGKPQSTNKKSTKKKKQELSSSPPSGPSHIVTDETNEQEWSGAGTLMLPQSCSSTTVGPLLGHGCPSPTPPI